MKKIKLSKAQKLAIRCAYADLVGAKQAHEQGDSNIHDWKGHQASIDELENAFPFVVPVSYMVEHHYSYGWDDAEWSLDDKPERFATKKEANKAITEFIKDQNDAVKAGHMSDRYKRSDYRVVPA